MRLFASLILLAVLAAAVAAAYIGYRQLETKRVLLVAPPASAASNSDSCNSMEFVLDARTVGDWFLLVEEGRTLSGAVTIAGGETADIGLRIFSPHNRLVFYTPQRSHHPEFALQADVRGEYRFEFDNRHSIFGKKQLDVSICLA